MSSIEPVLADKTNILADAKRVAQSDKLAKDMQDSVLTELFEDMLDDQSAIIAYKVFLKANLKRDVRRQRNKILDSVVREALNGIIEGEKQQEAKKMVEHQ